MEADKKALGMISDIQSFSLHDGPGIRTSVFLKGCPLRCVWCHNPETMLMKAQPSRNLNKCVGCARCEAACPVGGINIASGSVDTARCISCGTCARECRQHAIRMLGTRMTPEEVAKKVLLDRTFYEHSGGGVTISGGEPLMQPVFTYELLRILKKEGIHTAVETCGFAKESVLSKVAEVTDLFLFDYKETDEVLHKKWTGVAPKQIHNNLKLLNTLNARVILRCPVIPGLNDRSDHFKGIAGVAGMFRNIEHVELMPYHNIGLDKAKQLGITQRADITVPSEDEKQAWRNAVISAGYDKVSI